MAETKRALEIFFDDMASGGLKRAGLQIMLDAVEDIQSDEEATRFLDKYYDALCVENDNAKAASILRSNVPMLWLRFEAGSVLQQGQMMNALERFNAALALTEGKNV